VRWHPGNQLMGVAVMVKENIKKAGFKDV